MKKKFVLGLFAAFLAAAVVAAAMRAAPQPPVPQAIELTHAPEVRFTMLSGESVATSELRGRAVVVNFWATYCGSCLKEMPRLVETFRKFAPRGYEVIAVAVSHDDQARVAQLAKHLPFKVAFDGDGTVAKQFGNVRVKPTTFVVDREGRIVKRYVGEPAWSELHTILDKL
jgi:peroxiredoxin